MPALCSVVSLINCRCVFPFYFHAFSKRYDIHEQNWFFPIYGHLLVNTTSYIKHNNIHLIYRE